MGFFRNCFVSFLAVWSAPALAHTVYNTCPLSVTASPWHSRKMLASGRDYVKELLPGVSSDVAYKITAYGAALKQNKAKLTAAFDKCKVSPSHRALLLALGMIETNTLDVADRDRGKDNNSDGSANVSLFNLSHDLVKRLGYGKNPTQLNDPKNLAEAVQLLEKGFNSWGIKKVLAYIRGGATGASTMSAYGVQDYLKTVATILKVISQNPSLLVDDRRVEIHLQHV